MAIYSNLSKQNAQSLTIDEVTDHKCADSPEESTSKQPLPPSDDVRHSNEPTDFSSMFQEPPSKDRK